MPAHTAVAAGDPDEPDQPMSAPRPDYLRPVATPTRTTAAPADHGAVAGDTDTSADPAHDRRPQLQDLPAAARAELADELRHRLAELDATANPKPATPDPTGTALDAATLIVPAGVLAAVTIGHTGDLAALVQIAQTGPVQLVRDGAVVATLTGAPA